MAKHDANKFRPVPPAPASESRAALLKGLSALIPLKSEIVELDGPDGKPSGFRVKVCELPTVERFEVSEAATTVEDGPDGKPVVKQSNAILFPLLVQRCSRDPESDEILWTDVASVGALPQAITGPLSRAALRVNGLVPDLPASASEGNGSGAVASSSSSPENSESSSTK